jgi:hypothetical protein
MPTTIGARITREEVGFSRFLFLSSWFVKPLKANFLFYQLDGCQVGLSNYWSCS